MARTGGAVKIRCALALVAALQAAPALAEHCPETRAAAERITALRDSDPAAGIEQGEAALAALENGGHPCPAEAARLHAAIGSNLNIMGRNAEAAAQFADALTQLEDVDNPELRATLHRGAGLALYDLGDFPAALVHYLDALAASEAAGDVVGAAKTAGNIGILHVTTGSLDRAQAFHERALAGFEAAGFQPGVAGTLVNLGALAAKLAAAADDAGDADAARRHNAALRAYNERALALFEELGNPRGVAYAASNVGLALDRLGEHGAGLSFHERSLAARRAIGDEFGIINSLTSLGASLTALRRFAEADARLAEAAALLPDSNPRLALTVHEPWAALEAARGDPAAALARHEIVDALRSEIADADRNERVAEIQARYDSVQQQQRIDDLQYEQTVTRLRLERQRAWLVTGAFVVVLLLAIVAGLVAWQRVSRRHASALERAARTDELTGLANRRDVRERIGYEIRRSRRSGRPFSVALLDIDGFKAVNDAFGHAAGDRGLIEIARRIEPALRRQDTLARWGGDELLVLMPETGERGAAVLARKLVEAVAAAPVPAGGATRVLSLTAGVSQFWPGSTVDDVVRAADDAMYRAKRAGKNQVMTSSGRETV